MPESAAVRQPALAQLTYASIGHNVLFYAIQMITLVLLGLAANTSFGGLPVLASLMASDNFLPHLFHLRAARQVHRYGVVVQPWLGESREHPTSGCASNGRSGIRAYGS